MCACLERRSHPPSVTTLFHLLQYLNTICRFDATLPPLAPPSTLLLRRLWSTRLAILTRRLNYDVEQWWQLEE